MSKLLVQEFSSLLIGTTMLWIPLQGARILINLAELRINFHLGYTYYYFTTPYFIQKFDI